MKRNGAATANDMSPSSVFDVFSCIKWVLETMNNVRESKTTGFQVLDSRSFSVDLEFWISDHGFRISDLFQWTLDSGFQLLVGFRIPTAFLRIPNPGFRILQAEISISGFKVQKLSGFPYMGRNDHFGEL